MVKEWIVDIDAFKTLNFFSSTSATGTKQLVVQEAIELTLSFSASKSSSLTPKIKVRPILPPLKGAVITTFLAPASRWADALSSSTKTPVDSTTKSMPKSFQGNFLG